MSKRLTISELLDLRGKRQLAMLRVETLDEAAAAEAAGIDMVSVPPELLERGFRDAAPTVFACAGLDYGEYITRDEYLRGAFAILKSGGDAVYCAAGNGVVRHMADEGMPVCGHTGLIPSKSTWTGGFRAVGKTLDTAKLVWRQVRDLEAAGAFAAEIEVVPDAVATEIAKRSSLFLISMGAGSGCHAQYLFSDDVLGQNRGHVPRHAKVYRNFARELDRLQAERIAAYTEYKRDIDTLAYPEQRHIVAADAEVVEAFVDWLNVE